MPEHDYESESLLRAISRLRHGGICGAHSSVAAAAEFLFVLNARVPSVSPLALFAAA
jgi:hypothetical protein